MTDHRCGEPRGAPYCLTCGCWGDTHPGACAGGDCTCDNLHYEGQPSRKEWEAERTRERGHYIVKHSTYGHYCQTPSEFYAWPGEVWQCDVCGRQWKFKRSLTDKIAGVRGSWR